MLVQRGQVKRCNMWVIVRDENEPAKIIQSGRQQTHPARNYEHSPIYQGRRFTTPDRPSRLDRRRTVTRDIGERRVCRVELGDPSRELDETRTMSALSLFGRVDSHLFHLRGAGGGIRDVHIVVTDNFSGRFPFEEDLTSWGSQLRDVVANIWLSDYAVRVVLK